MLFQQILQSVHDPGVISGAQVYDGGIIVAGPDLRNVSLQSVDIPCRHLGHMLQYPGCRVDAVDKSRHGYPLFGDRLVVSHRYTSYTRYAGILFFKLLHMLLEAVGSGSHYDKLR